MVPKKFWFHQDRIALSIPLGNKFGTKSTSVMTDHEKDNTFLSRGRCKPKITLVHSLKRKSN